MKDRVQISLFCRQIRSFSRAIPSSHDVRSFALHELPDMVAQPRLQSRAIKQPWAESSEGLGQNNPVPLMSCSAQVFCHSDGMLTNIAKLYLVSNERRLQMWLARFIFEFWKFSLWLVCVCVCFSLLCMPGWLILELVGILLASFSISNKGMLGSESHGILKLQTTSFPFWAISLTRFYTYKSWANIYCGTDLSGHVYLTS